MQYNQLLDITLRPVADLFVVRDLDDPNGNYIPLTWMTLGIRSTSLSHLLL